MTTLKHICGVLILALTLYFPTPGLAGPDQKRVRVAGDVFEFLLPGSAAFWTLAIRDYPGTGRFAASWFTTMGITQVMKRTIDAPRPAPRQGRLDAMPSGHTSTAFAGASFMQRRYGWAFGVPYYLLAAYTGWSRVYSDFHHPRDVAVGATIAIASTLVWVPRISDRVQLLPFGRGGYGLRISRHF